RDVEAVFYRPRAQEQVPMILARVEREVRGNGGEQRALEREDPVQLREAQVVADGEPDAPALGLRDNRLLAMLLGLGLAVREAADLDVEEVDLAIRSDEVALRIEDEASVRELLAALAPLGDRPSDERDAVRARPPAHRGDR